MNKDNIFQSSQFYMDIGDVLHMIIDNEVGGTIDVELFGTAGSEAGIVQDYDGNEYVTITVGTQQWIGSNLRTTHYANGVVIPNLTTDATWHADVTGAYCWYDNDITNATPYGAIYNFWAVKNANGLAYFKKDGVQQTGWRIPTIADITTLQTFLGSEAGGKLKEQGTDHWNSPNVATNETGMSIVGGGEREAVGSFLRLKEITYLWTSTDDGFGDGEYYYIQNNLPILNTSVGLAVEPIYGFSVRCVRDV